jgi:serine/threonine protein kinase
MPLAAGDKIGPYEISSLVGAGGMGEVYRATDTRLRREVAIKVLSGASSAESRARFLQEARAASALNHPNIVQIYDVGSIDFLDFIVMELVAGESLTQAIGPAGLAIATALDYAIQIAGALAAAHATGIVHRDIKPGNVRISNGGVVKVLDFGLAKLAGAAAASTEAETRTLEPKTVEGTVIGTLVYMSPEQAECKPVDRRSDIFSFGVLLYEMLTGQRVFQRDSTAATLSAILRDEPPSLTRGAKRFPRELERIIATCLRKDPAARYQTMDDVASALRGIRTEVRARRIPDLRLAWIIPVVAIVSVVWWMWPRNSTLRAIDLTRVTSDTGLTIDPILSRDGKLLAYSSDRAGGILNIWVQQVGSAEPIQITNDTVDSSQPSFSPDGTWIAFRSEHDGGGIYVIPALGGTARRIAAEGQQPRFSPDGAWIAYWVGDQNVYSSNRVYVVPRTGGEPKRIAPTLFSAFSPVWSPDGKFLLLVGAQTDQQPAAQQRDWWVAPLDGGPLVKTGALAYLAANGVYPHSQRPGFWTGDSILFSGTTNSYAAIIRSSAVGLRRPSTWQGHRRAVATPSPAASRRHTSNGQRRPGGRASPQARRPWRRACRLWF